MPEASQTGSHLRVAPANPKTISNERTNERTQRSLADVSLETAVDAGARIEDSIDRDSERIARLLAHARTSQSPHEYSCACGQWRGTTFQQHAAHVAAALSALGQDTEALGAAGGEVAGD